MFQIIYFPVDLLSLEGGEGGKAALKDRRTDTEQYALYSSKTDTVINSSLMAMVRLFFPLSQLI